MMIGWATGYTFPTYLYSFPRSMGSDVNRLVKHSRPYKQEQTPHGHKKKKKKTTIYDDYKDLE
jgi:hypothetical protein